MKQVEGVTTTIETNANAVRRSSAILQSRYAGLVFMRNRLGGILFCCSFCE